MAEKQSLLDDIATKSLIIGIFGIRGSGKTNKGYNLLDICHSSGRPTYIFGFPQKKQTLLPSHIKIAETIGSVPKGASILIDEASLFYFSKEFMSQASKKLFKMMITARHRNQTMIFTTVTAATINLDIIRLLDVIFYCKPSRFLEIFEREKLRWVAEKARTEFKNISGDHRPYAYVWSEEWEGMTQWNLPTYWSEELSKYLGDHMDKQEKPQNLPKRYLHILKLIQKGISKPNLIRDHHNLDKQAVSRILEELKDLGLVVRSRFRGNYKLTEQALDHL